MFALFGVTMLRQGSQWWLFLSLYGKDRSAKFCACLGHPGLGRKGYQLISPRLIQNIVEAAMGHGKGIFHSFQGGHTLLFAFSQPVNICTAHGHIVKEVIWINDRPVCEGFADELREEAREAIRD